jgi:hypothetical protein
MPDQKTTDALPGAVPVDEYLESALACLDSVHVSPGQYAERPRARPTSSGAALATAVRHIANIPPAGLEDERGLIAENFLSIQRPATGAFDDPARNTPSKRLNIPLFGWIVRALAMLDTKPEHHTTFMRRWDDAEELIWWLGLLEWQRASRQESLRVMNIGVPRINRLKAGVQKLERSVRSLLNWLMTHQDRASGLWGPGLAEGLGATFHILVLFDAAEQRPPMGERIAQTVIDLYDDEKGWGDSWANMAALSTLAKTTKEAGVYEERAKELALDAVKFLTPDRSSAAAYGTSLCSLSEIVTRLEGLRAAALMTEHPALEQCRGWRSAWDPVLWVCEW